MTTISPAEYREVASQLQKAQAAVVAAHDVAVKVSGSRMLERSFNASFNNLLTVRIRLMVEMSRQHGQEAAEALFFGHGWEVRFR